MARLIFASHGDDLYVEVQWVDAHGHHSRRVTEDLSPTQHGGIDALCGSQPDILRWQLDRVRHSINIGTMSEGETGPSYRLKLTKQQTDFCMSLLEWAEAEVRDQHRPANDAYEEGRRLDREQVHIDKRRATLEKRSGGG